MNATQKAQYDGLLNQGYGCEAAYFAAYEAGEISNGNRRHISDWPVGSYRAA